MTNIIYLRTSTIIQNPENQLNDNEELANRLNLECEVLSEQESAFKDEDRPVFEGICARIKSLEVKNLIVWDVDRLYRNRKNLVLFFQFCKTYGCKVHSFRQSWLEDINRMPEPWNEIVFELMLQIFGWIAEDESRKKGQRVKNAVRKKDGVTTSYKGSKWGRKGLNLKVIHQVEELYHQNNSIRDISKQVFYFDKNNNKKQISKSAVHKILSKFKGDNIRK